ncbi:hypothetical protein [Dipodfec virus UOA04_Rod_660]|nr:hypothetical protein [Dipodfec virus UOA04_Rod_660]
MASPAGESALFSIVLLSYFMDTPTPFYKTKRFWTLVSSIVAALTAFFLTSCSVQARVSRSGIHIDTVRVDYIVRSRSQIDF